MASIQTKKINGHGPYAYRVEYVGNGKHEWESLGPVRDLNMSDLDVTSESSSKQDEIRKQQRNTSADLQRREIANELRDEFIERYGPEIISDDDDRRKTTVELADDAPRDAIRSMNAQAEDMQAAVSGSGQEQLTNEEKKRIDFSDVSIFHARSAKAAIKDEGIDDWQAVYDPTTTVDSNREIAKENRESIVGDRLDNDEGPRKTGTTEKQAQSEQEKQALKYAKNGDEAAQEFLTTERGWTADEIEATPAPVNV